MKNKIMQNITRTLLIAVAVFLMPGGLQLAAQELPKGVAPMQEVESSGVGDTRNEAFKQAVTDAVRQVVGTLVSAEQQVNNDKIIKDELLTLSNGFVEQVIHKQEARRKDGTWLVKLKCVVRKGQVYGSLKKANVPTMKFDGVSMFADVLSQNEHRESSVGMIRRAMEGFNETLVSATMLDQKPRIVESGTKDTKLAFTWAAEVDLNAFFNNVAPALDAAFTGAAKTSANKREIMLKTKDYGFLWSSPRLRGGIENSGKVERPEEVMIPIKQGRFLWTLRKYNIDRKITRQLPDAYKLLLVVAQFIDKHGRCISERHLTCLQLGEHRGIFRSRGGHIRSDAHQTNGFSLVPIMIPLYWAHRTSPGALCRPFYFNNKHHFDSAYGSFRADALSGAGGTLGLFGNLDRDNADYQFLTPEFYDGGTFLKFQSGVNISTELLPEIAQVRLIVECLEMEKPGLLTGNSDTYLKRKSQ